MEFLQTPIAHEVWMAQQGGGFLTPLKTVNTELYVDDIRARLATSCSAPPRSASTGPT
jgi:alpha-glucoside transport system substrate-binding protein